MTVTVTAPSVPPTAVNDTATTNTNTAVTVNVLGNDTAGTNAINPASVVVVSQPANGSAVANLNGTITYTPALGFSGGNSFTYNVKDTAGAVSNTATVAVTVNAPLTETLAVTRAQFTLNGATWRIDGTVAPPTAGETITIFNNTTVGTAPLTTVTVAGNGSWTWSSPNNAPAPNALRKISVQSSLGTKLEGITVTVR